MAFTPWAPSHWLFPSSALPSIARPQSSTVSPSPPASAQIYVFPQRIEILPLPSQDPTTC